MSDRAELAALVQELGDLLRAQAAAGVGGEAVQEAPVERIEAAVTLPPPVMAWGQRAAVAREARTPVHHQELPGAAGLAAIRADLGDCRRCALCEGRRSIVFGVGSPDADLMVVGEGPGEQEDLTGEPFVGPAGEMLDKMLANVVGLRRSEVYIANIVKCRPPGNRNPEAAEADVCKGFLHRQIAAVKPKILLVLGGVATEYLLGEKGITRLRGKELSFGGIPALPTFHPAYLLRMPDQKRLVFEDLKLLRARYDALGGKRSSA